MGQAKESFEKANPRVWIRPLRLGKTVAVRRSVSPIVTLLFKGAWSDSRGRCVRGFLRLCLIELRLSPKPTMEMGVYGSSDTPRVSPAPITSTSRQHAHADRVGRCGVAAVRRCGGAAVRRCRASARTYGWDTLEPFITIKLGGRRYFAMSGHAGRLCVRGFLRLGSYTDLCAVKNYNGNGRPACPER